MIRSNTQTHPFNHVVGGLEIGQHDTDVSLIIGSLLKGAETALHGLHGERPGSVAELCGSDRVGFRARRKGKAKRNGEMRWK